MSLQCHLRNEMKFSVIIPVYNGEKFIKDAAKSALSCNKGQMELVIVDNGSTDQTAAICKELALEHSCVRTFHVDKIGAYRARRFGMEKASGDYMLFLDADDRLKSYALKVLESAVAAASQDSRGPDMILYNAENMNAPGTRKFGFEFEDGHVYDREHKKPFLDLMCKRDSLNALWNKAISRQLAERILKSPDLDLPEVLGGVLNHGEDLLQTADILDKADSIVYVDQILYEYRPENSGSLTGKYSGVFFDEQEFAWKMLESYARKWQSEYGDSDYMKLINERKTLTCSIGTKSLLFSSLPMNEIKARLTEIMDKPFYKEYAGGELPKWAPEEDRFIHSLQTSADPRAELLRQCKKVRFKAKIKRLLGRG